MRCNHGKKKEEKEWKKESLTNKMATFINFAYIYIF